MISSLEKNPLKLYFPRRSLDPCTIINKVITRCDYIINTLSFNETNDLSIKKIRSVRISLFFSSVKMSRWICRKGVISWEIDQTAVCAQSLEYSRARNITVSWATVQIGGKIDLIWMFHGRESLRRALLLEQDPASLGTSERKRVSRFVKRGEFRSDTTHAWIYHNAASCVTIRYDRKEVQFNKTLPTLIIKIFDCVSILNIYSKSGKGSIII